jgi:hypothetical protein
MVVDFPGPFGPKNPVTRPGRAEKLMSSTAVKPPYGGGTTRSSEGWRRGGDQEEQPSENAVLRSASIGTF